MMKVTTSPYGTIHSSPPASETRRQPIHVSQDSTFPSTTTTTTATTTNQPVVPSSQRRHVEANETNGTHEDLNHDNNRSSPPSAASNARKTSGAATIPTTNDPEERKVDNDTLPHHHEEAAPTTRNGVDARHHHHNGIPRNGSSITTNGTEEMILSSSSAASSASSASSSASPGAPLGMPSVAPWDGKYFENSSKTLRVRQTTSAGLRNAGNTCYLNSVLQCLANCRPLMGYFLVGYPYTHAARGGVRNESEAFVSDEARRNLLELSAETFGDMWSGRFRDFAPRRLMRCLIDSVPEFRPYGQQDAHEALGYLLNHLHDELFHPVPAELHPGRYTMKKILETSPPDSAVRKKPFPELTAPYEQSVVADTFKITLTQQCVCSHCNTESWTLNQEMMLLLTLPSKQQVKDLNNGSGGVNGYHSSSSLSSNSSNTNNNNNNGGGFFTNFLGSVRNVVAGPPAPALHLEDCLREFFQVERLTGEHVYVCDACEKRREATKEYRIAEQPEVLCIGLKRFAASSASSSGAGGATKAISRLFGGNGKITTNVKYPIRGLSLAKYLHEHASPGSREEVYDLFAVVRHTGSLDSGHYVCVVKHPFVSEPTRWFAYDDEIVQAVPYHPDSAKHSSEEVLQFSDAYLLFYSKRSTESQLEARRTVDRLLATYAPDAPQNPASRQHYYIPAAWALKYETMVKPGPIDCLTFACYEHGGGTVPAWSTMSERALAVDEEVFETLKRVYGFVGKPCTDLSRPCPECEKEFVALEQRRREELERVQAFDNPAAGGEDDGDVYFVASRWFVRWRRFVRNEPPVLGRTTWRGTEPPGSIDNLTAFFTKDGSSLRPNLKHRVDYRCVNRKIWEYWVSIYGGGPTVRRKGTWDIYAGVEMPPSSSSTSFVSPPNTRPRNSL